MPYQKINTYRNYIETFETRVEKKRKEKTMIGKNLFPTCFQSTNTFENCIETSKQ
jgi:hypothetical protein